MLGTGIASAQENVNPDTPPSTIDGGVTVPIDIEHNSFSTPEGQRELPEFHREMAFSDQGASANPLIRNPADRAETKYATRGNVVQPTVVAPVNVCGNAVAAGGDAAVDAECGQTATQPHAVYTDGSNGAVAGNAAVVGMAIPAQVTGNAVAVIGEADAHTTADQAASTGGDVTTSGDRGSLSGNIVAAQGAVPVQATNNAVGGAGNAYTDSKARSAAASNGSLKTDGDDSTAGGNVVGVPLAPIAAVNGNAVAGGGNADSVAENWASSDAGTTRPGINGLPNWTETSGDPATLAGNAVQPQFAGPVSVDDNALAGAGNSSAKSSTVNRSESGGNSRTTGEDSTLSGNLADAPVALPVSGGGNAASVVGTTSAEHANDVVAHSGGGTYTRGDGATLGANTLSAAPAGAVDACGIALGGAGDADALCDNDVTSETGGYNGTTGNDSVLSGNIAQLPAAVPAEAYGLSGGVVGSGTSTTNEEKVIKAGGTPNSDDDNGTVSSNIVTAPTAVGAQAFGDAVALAGNPNTDTASDTTLVAGGPARATGHHGSVSGNIFEVPTSNPVQAFGNTVVGVGNGSSNVDSALDSTAGGDAVSDGAEGAVAGNVLSVPEASAVQVFGDAVGVGSNVESDAANEYSSISGGDITTAGDRGSLAGNGVTTPVAAPVQVFGDTATAVANGDSETLSDTVVAAGGDSTTSGKDASLSGNLVEVPTNAAAMVFGEPATVGGLAKTTSDSTLLSESGGETSTIGSGDVTAHDVSAPVESAVQVYDVPVEVLGTAVSNVYTKASQLTAEETEAANLARGVQIPKSIDSLLGSAEVPGLSGLNRLPVQRDALAPRSVQNSEVPQIPAIVIPYATMRGGVFVPADVVDHALLTAPANASQLTAEDTEAANLARGVQIPKSIDSLLGSAEVPNLTAFELPVQRGRLTPRLTQLPEAHLSDNPTVNGVPVPAGRSVREVSDGVNTVNTADVSAPIGPKINGGGIAMTNDRLPVKPQFAVDRTSDAAGLTKMTLPKGSYFDKVSDTTGSDVPGQAERAVNTVSDTVVAQTPPPVPHQHVNLTEDRSFSGSLLPDAGFGTGSVVRSLSPFGSSGRNLTSTPSLPVSAPALPVVLPVVPVSQPRAMSNGIPLDDIKFNPTSSYADIPVIPFGNERSYRSPAPAGLNTRTMFGSLEDTLQFERAV